MNSDNGERPASIASRILALHDTGYSAKEILLQLKGESGLGKLTQSRVNAVLRQSGKRSADSRYIFEIREMLIEVLAMVREIASRKERKQIEQRMRSLERSLTGPRPQDPPTPTAEEGRRICG